MARTVLTVDDSPSMRDMIAFTMESAGYSALTAADGLEALEVMRSTTVDLVVTDVNMPNLDGFGLIRELRATAQYAKTPILLLTTESSAAMKQAGRAAGATGWVVKPFDPKTLLGLIEKLIGR